MVSSLTVLERSRESWGLPKHKELCFRGESRDYGETILHPELYRPKDSGSPLKPTNKLLDIEYDLYEAFQRNAPERGERISESEWDWDSYFLMQHHDGPTRLLDWSDGALLALHFALRQKADEQQGQDARVYVLEVYRFMEHIKQLAEVKSIKDDWKCFLKKHPSYDLNEEEWEYAYLPADEADRMDMNVPLPPLVVRNDLITRRIAAQRSRFILFGTEPNWLRDEFKKEAGSTVRLITISARSRPKIRQELRDCGITESVIYPDLDGLGREVRQMWEDRRAAGEENS